MTIKIAKEIARVSNGLISVYKDLRASKSQDPDPLEIQVQELIHTLETVWNRTRTELRALIEDPDHEPIRSLLEDVLEAKNQASFRRKAERLIDEALKEAASKAASKAAQQAMYKLLHRARSPLLGDPVALPDYPLSEVPF
jgi:hypothetical protein